MTDKIKLVCAQCETINQFPLARLDETPKCAQCKNPLFSGHPITINHEQLIRHLDNSDLPVLVDFWAPWCGPCQGFAPIYNEFAQRVGNQLRVLKLDTQDNQRSAQAFNIRSIPTLVLFVRGQEVARVSGALNLVQLQQWVLEQLSG